MAAQTATASEQTPVTLEVVGAQRTGEPPRSALQAGTAVQIATGGAVPAGADAIVMVEQTETDAHGNVRIRRAARRGQHVIGEDDDFAVGSMLLEAGHPIGARQLAALSAAGIRELAVRARPRVAIISTGDEVVAPETTELRAGQVRDAIAPAIAALVEQAHGVAVRRGIVPDDEAALEAACRAALADCDMLVLSAGSSIGERDLTACVVERLGPPGIWCHGLALRPGKPTLLAEVSGKPVIGLPGNPLSALVVFDLIGSPIVRRLAGFAFEPMRATVHAVLGHDVVSARGRLDILQVQLVGGEVQSAAERLGAALDARPRRRPARGPGGTRGDRGRRAGRDLAVDSVRRILVGVVLLGSIAGALRCERVRDRRTAVARGARAVPRRRACAPVGRARGRGPLERVGREDPPRRGARGTGCGPHPFDRCGSVRRDRRPRTRRRSARRCRDRGAAGELRPARQHPGRGTRAGPRARLRARAEGLLDHDAAGGRPLEDLRRACTTALGVRLSRARADGRRGRRQAVRREGEAGASGIPVLPDAADPATGHPRDGARVPGEQPRHHGDRLGRSAGTLVAARARQPPPRELRDVPVGAGRQPDRDPALGRAPARRPRSPTWPDAPARSRRSTPTGSTPDAGATACGRSGRSTATRARRTPSCRSGRLPQRPRASRSRRTAALAPRHRRGRDGRRGDPALPSPADPQGRPRSASSASPARVPRRRRTRWASSSRNPRRRRATSSSPTAAT